MRAVFRAFGKALDPRTKIEDVAPRSILFVRGAMEYFFRVTGFFLASCLAIGLLLASCSEDPVLLLLPLLIVSAFFFYIAITTFTLPLFIVIGEIKSRLIRRLSGWTILALTFALTVYSIDRSPITDLLGTYVVRLFPEHANCKSNVIDFEEDESTDMEP